MSIQLILISLLAVPRQQCQGVQVIRETGQVEKQTALTSQIMLWGPRNGPIAMFTKSAGSQHLIVAAGSLHGSCAGSLQLVAACNGTDLRTRASRITYAWSGVGYEVPVLIWKGM